MVSVSIMHSTSTEIGPRDAMPKHVAMHTIARKYLFAAPQQSAKKLQQKV